VASTVGDVNTRCDATQQNSVKNGNDQNWRNNFVESGRKSIHITRSDSTNCFVELSRIGWSESAFSVLRVATRSARLILHSTTDNHLGKWQMLSSFVFKVHVSQNTPGEFDTEATTRGKCFCWCFHTDISQNARDNLHDLWLEKSDLKPSVWKCEFWPSKYVESFAKFGCTAWNAHF